MTAIRAASRQATRTAAPRYELRLNRHGPGDSEMRVYRLPTLGSELSEPDFVGGLRGAALERFEPRILRILRREGIRLGPGQPGRRNVQPLDEETSLILGLLFRTLAPMRNRDNMQACVDGIERMGREEAAYWLGMVMHRRKPRRVLQALRIVLNASED
ncbi:MAG: hypothetical protein JSR56_06190 [Proteobacteria bacterium]|nr:hypothetical protein [Pseudomonadota bacterium]